MKVIVTEVAGFGQTLMAAGLQSLLHELEGGAVEVEGLDRPIAGKPVALPPPPIPAALEAPAPKSAPVKAGKRKYAKHARAAAPPSKPKESGEVRITIRMRILALLKDRVLSAREIVTALEKQNVSSDVALAGQHCYLLTRDGLACRDDEKGGWGLTPKGRAAAN